MHEQLLDFTGSLSIHFFNSSHSLIYPFHSTLTQLVRLPGVTYHLLCSLCDLRDVMPRHWSPSASHLSLG